MTFLLLCAFGAKGEVITGTVIIKRRLTKASVAPTIGLYERGPFVEAAKPSNDDPLVLERERVAVYLEGGTPAEESSATLSQSGRRFVPEMIVIPAGSSVSFPNLDPIFHNVFSLSKYKSFDLGNYPKGETRTVRFEKPGIVFVNCHLHPNMTATIVVTPNSWCAKPGADGRYEIGDVPPGEYTIVAWHKAAGFFRRSVVVTQHQGAHKMDFLIPLDADSREMTVSEKRR